MQSHKTLANEMTYLYTIVRIILCVCTDTLACVYDTLAFMHECL